jgi:hypothetical protein
MKLSVILFFHGQGIIDVMSLSNIDKPNAAAKFKFHISFGAALAKI